MQRADVIHRRGANYHERADHQRAVHARQSEPQVGLQTLPGLLVKLSNFKFFASKRVHHSNRTQSFLRLSQDGALLFLNGC